MTPALRALLDRHPAPWRTSQENSHYVRVEDANGQNVPTAFLDRELLVSLVNRAAEELA